MKRMIMILVMLVVSLFCTIILTSCDDWDRDGDGFLDEFEEEQPGLDPDVYNWNEDSF